MVKKFRPSRRYECAFRCLYRDGTIEFPVWPRKGQTGSEACLTKLRSLIGDRSSLCELIRWRLLDGIPRRIRIVPEKQS